MDKQGHFEAETVREYDELVRNLSLSLSIYNSQSSWKDPPFARNLVQARCLAESSQKKQGVG